MFSRFKEQSFPCLESLHGNPWSSLGTPSHQSKGMLFSIFSPVDVRACMVPFMDLGDKKLLMFILALSSSLSTPWTQSWHILPVFPLSFYWSASSHFWLSSIQSTSYLDYSTSPYLCSATEMVLELRSVIFFQLGSWTNTKGIHWMEQTVAFMDKSGHHFLSY